MDWRVKWRVEGSSGTGGWVGVGPVLKGCTQTRPLRVLNYGSLVLEMSSRKRRAPPPSAEHKVTRTHEGNNMPGAPTTDD